MSVGVGYALAEEVAILKAMFRAAGFVAYQGPAGGYFIMLHTAEPGPAGTNAPANSSRRVALGAVTVNAGTGVATNNGDITFAAVTATQTYTHYSAWDASSGGNFKFDGTLTGTGTIGQDFVIAAGDFTASLLTDL